MAATSSFLKLSFIPSDSTFIFFSLLPANISIATSFFHGSHFILPEALSLSFLPTAVSSSFLFLLANISISTSFFHSSDFILPQCLSFIPAGEYFNCDFILSRRPLHPLVSSLSFLATALSPSFSFLAAYISIATSFFHGSDFIFSQALCFIPGGIYFNGNFILPQQRLHPSPSSPSLSLLPTALSSLFSFLLTYISIATSLFHGSDFILPQALPPFHCFRQRFHLRFHSYQHIFQLRLHSFTAATSSCPKLSFIPSNSTFIFVFLPSGIYFNFDFILSWRPLHPSVSSLSFLPTALSSSFSLIPAYISIVTSFFHGGHLILAQVLFHSFRQHFHLLGFHSCRCTFQSRQWPLHPLLDCVSFLPSGYIM